VLEYSRFKITGNRLASKFCIAVPIANIIFSALVPHILLELIRRCQLSAVLKVFFHGAYW